MHDTRCLADVHEGEQVAVRALLFDVVRDRYFPLGVHEGETVRCVASSSIELTVLTATGGCVNVQRDHARFVEVAAT